MNKNNNANKIVITLIAFIMIFIPFIVFIPRIISNNNMFFSVVGLFSILPSFMFILIAGIIIYVVIIGIKKYQQEQEYFAKNPNARKESFVDPESITYKELSIIDIKKIDNTIIKDIFNNYFNALFEVFESGYNKLNANILKNTVTNEFYEDLKLRFSLKKENEKPKYDINIKELRNPSITKIYNDKNNIYIEVYTYVEINKYLEYFSKLFNTSTINTIFKSNELYRVVLIKNINNIDKCPNCNAKLANYDKCSYCGSSINQFANKYKISSVDKLAVLNYRYDTDNKKWVPARML